MLSSFVNCRLFIVMFHDIMALQGATQTFLGFIIVPRYYQAGDRGTIIKPFSLHNIGIMVRCQIQNCDKTLKFTDLIRHLKSHIDMGTEINCPAQGCARMFSKKSSFTAHLSVKHGTPSRVIVDTNMLVHCQESDNAVCDETVNSESADLNIVESDIHVPYNDEEINKESFLRNFALFFLRLQCRYNVPVSTVDLIAREIDNLHQLGLETCARALRLRLRGENMESESVDEIVSEIKKNDVFNISLNSDDGILRSQHKRELFYKNNFRYVDPVQKFLGYNQYGKPCKFHYVSLKQTLMSLLQDKSVMECLESSSFVEQEVFRDLHDGKVYKHICQTVEHSSFLELILYQDAFEVVNPLGSARKIHKVVAVYMALANLPSYARTTIDNLQLVILCREVDFTYFGQDKVFKFLVDELRDLEIHGVCINGGVIKSRLLCILGDNLGSHWLGGFTTNFSGNSYICRYCLVQRTNNKQSLLQTAALRTPENYDNAANSLNENTLSCQGVVRQSPFNSLTHYHVCMPGLPPCLGHDLFEGVVQFDVALMLKKMCTCNKECSAMSYKYLNRCVKNFKYLGTDARDKPGHIADGKTVGGHAVQVWCLLRLLPTLLCDVVDVSDEAWQLLLLLREIVELICAPKVSFAQILYLNRLVNLYVEERLKLFPADPLRPKHHYLLHYPWLIQMYGPLIRVWTMRMESKHSFFKRSARSSHNFVNITKTLSETHQLNQAFLSTGSLVFDRLELGCDCCPFDETLFAASVVTAVKLRNDLHLPIHCSSSIIVKGTKYWKDAYVVTGCDCSMPVFGKVMLCLLDRRGVGALVVSVCQSEKNLSLGLYSLHSCDDLQVMKCLLIDELHDYCPLPAYSVMGKPNIALKHAVYVSV